MTWFSSLRLLAFVRRGVLALERIAVACESMNTMAKSDWERKHARPKPNPVVIESFDVAEANRRYREELEAADMERH